MAFPVRVLPLNRGRCEALPRSHFLGPLLHPLAELSLALRLCFQFWAHGGPTVGLLRRGAGTRSGFRRSHTRLRSRASRPRTRACTSSTSPRSRDGPPRLGGPRRTRDIRRRWSASGVLDRTNGRGRSQFILILRCFQSRIQVVEKKCWRDPYARDRVPNPFLPLGSVRDQSFLRHRFVVRGGWRANTVKGGPTSFSLAS